jgi:hypothetical protein
MQSSTRQAFVPSRPASRASHLVDQAQFPANARPCQPDHQSEPAYSTGTAKPLNISSLSSNKRQSQSKSQPGQRQSKSTFENIAQSIARSLSPNQSPNTATNMRPNPQQILNIAQPRPSSPAAFFALSGLNASTFKVPTIPQSKYTSRPPSVAEMQNSTHMASESNFSGRATSSMNLDASNVNTISTTGPVTPSVTKFRPRSSTVSTSLEQIRETVEEDETPAHTQVPFGHDGPQRVMMPSDLPEDGEVGTAEISYFTGHKQLRRSKRNRSKTTEDNDDNEFEFGSQMKRSKGDGTEVGSKF